MRTVRVRIAVAVDSDGDWSAYGWPTAGDPVQVDFVRAAALRALDAELATVHWIEADVPIPAGATIEGTVMPDAAGEGR